MKEKYYIASFSGGKDSTAMVLRLIELGSPLNEVINVDTGMEFPAMYTHIEKIKKIIESHGIKYTTLKSQHSFEYYLLEHEFTDSQGKKHKGYSWTRNKCRWCTAFLKTVIVRRYNKTLRATYDIYEYIGLAKDEEKRLQRKSNQNSHHIHPLADWGWTEQDALDYCKEKGYTWGGLYDLFSRVSCWCCPLQRMGELKKLYMYFPDLWQKLKEMDSKTDMPYKADYSVEMLEARFQLEEEREKQGLTINPHTKEFRTALNERLQTFPIKDGRKDKILKEGD